jgi:hypothetical protein
MTTKCFSLRDRWIFRSGRQLDEEIQSLKNPNHALKSKKQWEISQNDEVISNIAS